jgi:23S rRNA pseudouridine1911/1915/1917 synthase
MSIDQEIDQLESEDDLFEHYNFVVDKGQQLMRIDLYLLLKISNTSRSRIQTGISAGAVRVNDILIKSNYKVKPLDVISVSFAQPPRDTEVIAEDIPIDIVFEDNDLMIINKSPGMVVHPAHGNWNGTLVNGLLYHCQQLPGTNEIRPGLVHRIDKDTSGLLVVAKSEYALTHLAKQFFDHSIERTYYAILWGVPKESKGTLRGNITRSPKDRKIMTILPEGSDDGKLAITHYEVIETFGFCSFVKFNLETGRTHQIRAHAQSMGHPLISDGSYGGDKIRFMSTMANFKQFVDNMFKTCPRQALHAHSLGFEHPISKTWVQYESNFPEDFSQLLTKLRNLNT